MFGKELAKARFGIHRNRRNENFLEFVKNPSRDRCYVTIFNLQHVVTFTTVPTYVEIVSFKIVEIFTFTTVCRNRLI
jgi:hypothetical protein